MKQYEVCASTGFSALDALLGGGLRRGELSCVAGSDPAAQTRILCEIAAAFARQTEENVLLTTVAGAEAEGERKAAAIRRLLAQATGWKEEALSRRFSVHCPTANDTDRIRSLLRADDTIGLVLIDRSEWLDADGRCGDLTLADCMWCDVCDRSVPPFCVPDVLKRTARTYAVPIIAAQRVPQPGTCSFYELGISPEFDHVAFLRETGGSLAFLPPQGDPLHMSGALAAAYHVWRRSGTLAEKHAAWREIVETVPDEAIPFANWKAPRESVHAFLRDYMALEDRLLREFYDADGQIAYNYYDPNFELLVDNREIYYKLNACLDDALAALEDSEGYQVWLYRIDLKNGLRTRALFDERHEPLEVKPEYPLFITEEEILWDSFVTLNRRFEDETELLSSEDDARFPPEENLQF